MCIRDSIQFTNRYRIADGKLSWSYAMPADCRAKMLDLLAPYTCLLYTSLPNSRNSVRPAAVVSAGRRHTSTGVLPTAEPRRTHDGTGLHATDDPVILRQPNRPDPTAGPDYFA